MNKTTQINKFKPSMYSIRQLNYGILISGIGLLLSYTVMVVLALYFLSVYPALFRDFIFNLNLFFGPEQFYSSLSRLPPALIDHYRHIVLCDFLVLFCYAIFGTLLSIKLRLQRGRTEIFSWWNSFFILAALANLGADIFLHILFHNYPTHLPFLVVLANILTLFKFFFLSCGIFYLTFLLIFIPKQSMAHNL